MLRFESQVPNVQKLKKNTTKIVTIAGINKPRLLPAALVIADTVGVAYVGTTIDASVPAPPNWIEHPVTIPPG